MDDTEDLLTLGDDDGNQDGNLDGNKDGGHKGVIILVVIFVILIVLIGLYFLIAYFLGLPPFSKEPLPGDRRDRDFIYFDGTYFGNIPDDGDTTPITFTDPNTGITYNLTYQTVESSADTCGALCLADGNCGAFSFNNPGPTANQCWFSNQNDVVPFGGGDIGIVEGAVGGIKIDF